MTGCNDRRILEKTGFINVISYDKLPNGELKYSISIPNADTESENSRLVLNTVGKSSREARINLAREVNLLLVSGQLRSVLFGETIAKDGIWEQMDTFIRDSTTSERMKIIMVDGDAGQLLEKEYKAHPRSGSYIDQLLKKEAMAQSIPEATLYTFTRDYYDDGIDPVVPILKDGGKSIVLSGIGLFRGDKYVSRINPKDSLLFAFLYGNFNHGQINIDLSQETQESKNVMVTSLISSREISVNHERNDEINVTINVKVRASVLEYRGKLHLSNKKERKKLEKELSENLTARSQQIIKLMQDHKSDNIGIGMYVRNSMSYKKWKDINWNEVFSKVNVKCNINLTFKDTGFRE